MVLPAKFLLAASALLATVDKGLWGSRGEMLEEEERLAMWRERGYEWPPTRFVPDTPGWRRLMTNRFAQIERDLPVDSEGRYEAFIQTAYSGYVAQNFTRLGFGLAKADKALIDDLRAAIRHAAETGEGLGTEPFDEVIPGPNDPWFVELPHLTDRVLEEMHPYVEAWSGVAVHPETCYGFRLYREGSRLLYHIDESQTHVLSVIMFIDASEDSSPWPIAIEDFEGNTHEVDLTPGDILFYESSKCFHGRPRPFKGSWYSAVFAHYSPVGYEDEVDHLMEGHYAVPPHWNDEAAAPPIPPDDKENRPLLKMAATSMYHPDCPGNWCVAEGTLKEWSGPGREGYWIAPDQSLHPLDVESAKQRILERKAQSSVPSEEL